MYYVEDVRSRRIVSTCLTMDEARSEACRLRFVYQALKICKDGVVLEIHTR